ncbi:O-antigen ligase family protein [Costertonia aggregata]|uniref:O-antigen ligase family protein n=1 Tax=Costertonia aggregata TaxID=343403 RepID=UPI0037422DF1
MLIILFFIFGIRRLWVRNQLLIFLFFIFSVSLFLSVMFFLDTYVFDLEQFSRENTTLLSWRDVIWEIFFEHYDPSVTELLFGYGNVGQFISGISYEYEYLFSNWPNPTQISLHNNTLQMLVDIGVIGILSFFSVLYYVVRFSIRQYRKFNNKIYLLIPGVVNYILLLGFSDIIVNISNIGVYFVIMFIIINTLYRPKTDNTP